MRWALLLVLAGCGSARRGPPVADVVAFSEEAQLGERAFAQRCSECHPEGEGGLAPPINNRPLPKFLIKTQIRTGLGAMPAFGEDELSDAEVDAIADYLVELRRSE